jgi:Tfp pilus assembly protein PilP
MTMKLAKTTAKLIAVLAAAICFVPGIWAQATPAPKPAKKAKAAKSAAAKPAPAKAPAREASPAATAPAADDKASTAGKRDPFMPLINEKKDAGGMEHLPPGKAGLVIASVRVDGTVKSPSGMIAVVSNPEQKVYFVREGDRLYDGDVEKIGLDGVTFKENSKDAFGKAVEHMVTKRIYPSAGEQQ